ncbi:ras and EF-hand domain-containing protein homolog [Watersipora subatra]|uniref:ras and EF-hand domain-containing protein homolog n=1 Tax=Watersipora subatra TaxID=2589382 RepID=UPI00355BACA1
MEELMTMGHEDIKELFHLCDANNSGFIERSELKSIVPGADSATLENLLTELDCDGDGKISFQELADGLHKLTGESLGPSIDSYNNGEELDKDEDRAMDNRLSWSCGNLAHGRPRLENTYSLSAEDESYDAYRKNSTLDLFGTLNSHSEAYMVYQHLAQQDAEMLSKFETFLREAVQQIKDHSTAKEELEQALTQEQRKQQERLDALEEEAEFMNRKIELKTTQQLESKHEEDKLRYQEEISILQENLEQMRQLQHDTSEQARLKHSSTKARLLQMEQELQRLTNEKREAETNALMATSQLATFKQAVKQQSFDHKEEWMLEYINEQENLVKQIEHLHGSTRKEVAALFKPSSYDEDRDYDFFIERLQEVVLVKESTATAPRMHFMEALRRKIGKFRREMNKRLHDANQDLNGELLTMRTKEHMMEPKRSKFVVQQAQGQTTPDQMILEHESPKAAHKISAETTEESKTTTKTSRQSSFKSRKPLLDQFSFVEVTPERIFKVIFAGDSGVGKTSVILHLCRGIFQSTVSSTLGIDFYTKNVQIDETNISLQLWDTAGQERFRCISTSYFRKTDGVILLYDCCSERSFINVRDWVATIRQASDYEDLPIMICANKVDLRREKVEAGCKIITTEMGQELANQCKTMFLELSAKTGEKLNFCLEKLARTMREREDMDIERYDTALHVDTFSSNKESASDKCCT